MPLNAKQDESAKDGDIEGTFRFDAVPVLLPCLRGCFNHFFRQLEKISHVRLLSAQVLVVVDSLGNGVHTQRAGHSKCSFLIRSSAI